MSMLLPKNLPMFKRFMNLDLLLPKYQQNLFLELYNTGIEKKKTVKDHHSVFTSGNACLILIKTHK